MKILIKIFFIGLIIFVAGIVLAVAMPTAIIRAFRTRVCLVRPELLTDIPIGGIIALQGLLIIIYSGLRLFMEWYISEEKND